MRASQPIPVPPVSAYVERMLVIEDVVLTAPFVLPLFANGRPTLLFLSAKATIDGRAAGHLTLFGQTIYPASLTINEDFILIAYFLKPFALFSLFGLAATELTDDPVDLRLLAGSAADELKEQLLHAGSTADMRRLLDSYILRLAGRAGSEKNGIIHYASSVIATDPSPEVMSRIQKELFVTERTFQRLFQKSIGLSPNLFRRICQFDAAFRQLNHQRRCRLSDIAFEHGYADQSHFIRAFKEFTNLTPRQYLQYGDEQAR